MIRRGDGGWSPKPEFEMKGHEVSAARAQRMKTQKGIVELFVEEITVFAVFENRDLP